MSEKNEKRGEKSGEKAAGKADVERFQAQLGRLRDEIGKVIVGHRVVVDGVLTCMLAGSHALLEGVPGLGKTLLVRTIADATSLEFARIQFTPDMMPADILGTMLIGEDASGRRELTFRKGPVFSNIVLADEINRATPKTQSALLEAMAEQRVTVAKTSYELDKPFFVLATQNPLESEGTYPLPEAQLDRFFFKLLVPFPGREELHEILSRTTGAGETHASPVVSRDELLAMQRLVREVPVTQGVQDYVVRLLQATHPDATRDDRVKRFVKFGSSPRGAQALLLASKIRALMEGRFAPALDDVRACALPALRHRVLLNFEGEAEGIKTDQLLERLLHDLPESAK